MFALLCFILIFQPIVADWCTIWVENGEPYFEMFDGLTAHKCSNLCSYPPGAGQTFSCTWLDRKFETCTMKVGCDGKEFVLTKGSVCPDLNGKSHTITDEDDIIGEVDCNGVGSANPNVIFLLMMFLGGSLALMWMVLADGGRFGGSGGIN